MKQMFRYALPILLAGCASSPDITHISSDMFLVSRGGVEHYHNPESPKSEAMRAASQFCYSQNMRIRVLEVIENRPPYTPEHLPFAEIRFTCIEKASSGLGNW